MSDFEFMDGYRDGRNLSVPEPSSNRSHCYRHSFAIGRAEMERRNLGSLKRILAAANEAEVKDKAL